MELIKLCSSKQNDEDVKQSSLIFDECVNLSGFDVSLAPKNVFFNPYDLVDYFIEIDYLDMEQFYTELISKNLEHVGVADTLYHYFMFRCRDGENKDWVFDQPFWWIHVEEHEAPSRVLH